MNAEQVQARRRALLESTFEALNTAGIPYGVVNGALGWPRTIGRDLDTLVPRAAHERAIAIVLESFKSAGLRTRTLRTPYEVALLFGFAFEPDGVWGVEVDFMPEYLWAGCRLRRELAAGDPLVHAGPFRIDPWGNFAKALLLQLLCGNTRKALANLHAGRWLWETGQAEILKQLRARLPGELVEALWQAVRAENGDALQALRGRLRWEIVRGSWRMEGFLSSLRNLWLWSAWRWKRTLLPWAPVPAVALAGGALERRKALLLALEARLAERSVFVKTPVAARESRRRRAFHVRHFMLPLWYDFKPGLCAPKPDLVLHMEELPDDDEAALLEMEKKITLAFLERSR